MSEILESLGTFLSGTGIAQLFGGGTDWWKTLIMFVFAGILVYLAIVKGFEPLLLLPIAIGMLLTNLPGAELFHMDFFITEGDVDYSRVLHEGGYLNIHYIGVKYRI